MPNPVVHFEIGCREMATTKEFFSDVFDWNIDAMNRVQPGEGGIGGHFTSLGHEPHQYVNFYIQVDDVAAYLEKVAAKGGKKLVGPIDLPNGTFAWFQDPGGNTLGLWKDKV